MRGGGLGPAPALIKISGPYLGHTLPPPNVYIYVNVLYGLELIVYIMYIISPYPFRHFIKVFTIL
jgi:hypothetical protein